MGDKILYFGERAAFSEGFMSEGVARILRDRIPGCCAVKRAHRQDDRQGTDFWAFRHELPALSIDVKVRETDYAPRGLDDLALETWSVIGEKPGWTRDTHKRTDYVLWYWQDTGRFFLVAFPPLCKVFSRYWKEWREKYQCNEQNSGGWRSECVFVPRLVLIEKLNAWQCGSLPLGGVEAV